MSAIAPLFATDKAMFIRVDRTHPRDSVTEVIGLPERFVNLLRARELQHDYIWHAVLGIPAGRVYRSTELVPVDVLHTGPLYEQIAVPAGLDYVLGAVIENNTQFFANLCFMQGAVDFDDEHKNRLAMLVPHVQILQQVTRRIAAGDAARREALLNFDRVRQALVVLDRSGYAIYTNATAERLLSRADGLRLKLGRFLFDSVATQAEFEHAIRNAVASGGSEELRVPRRLRVARRDAGPPFVLSVIPVTSWSDRALLPEGAGCMVLIVDEERRPPLPVERLTWLYQLTPAEARTCEALYQAGSVEAAAGLLSLTQHTVRSHLKSVYPKFGVASQSQLMRRLATAANQPVDDSESVRA